jgi:endo-1,4-beta-xylanase
LKDHITTVVSRYKGKIYGWDVVNEAIDDNPNNFLRNDLFYQICGEDYIAKAFEYAHTADPNAVLFYNDYNLVRKEKIDRVYKLLKQLKEKGVPVDAVGIQGHWSIFEPSKEQLEYAINKFTSLGLKIQITELDMSLYKWEKNRRRKTAGDLDVYTPELEQKQADQYKMIFDVLRQHKKDITGVTFWNLSDKHTWLDNYPVPGRKNYPLLFDTTMKPKKAYWEVVNFEK